MPADRPWRVRLRYRAPGDDHKGWASRQWRVTAHTPEEACHSVLPDAFGGALAEQPPQSRTSPTPSGGCIVDMAGLVAAPAQKESKFWHRDLHSAPSEYQIEAEPEQTNDRQFPPFVCTRARMKNRFFHDPERGWSWETQDRLTETAHKASVWGLGSSRETQNYFYGLLWKAADICVEMVNDKTITPAELPGLYKSLAAALMRPWQDPPPTDNPVNVLTAMARLGLGAAIASTVGGYGHHTVANVNGHRRRKPWVRFTVSPSLLKELIEMTGGQNAKKDEARISVRDYPEYAVRSAMDYTPAKTGSTRTRMLYGLTDTRIYHTPGTPGVDEPEELRLENVSTPYPTVHLTSETNRKHQPEFGLSPDSAGVALLFMQRDPSRDPSEYSCAIAPAARHSETAALLALSSTDLFPPEDVIHTTFEIHEPDGRCWGSVRREYEIKTATLLGLRCLSEGLDEHLTMFIYMLIVTLGKQGDPVTAIAVRCLSSLLRGTVQEVLPYRPRGELDAWLAHGDTGDMQRVSYLIFRAYPQLGYLGTLWLSPRRDDIEKHISNSTDHKRAGNGAQWLYAANLLCCFPPLSGRARGLAERLKKQLH